MALIINVSNNSRYYDFEEQNYNNSLSVRKILHFPRELPCSRKCLRGIKVRGFDPGSANIKYANIIHFICYLNLSREHVCPNIKLQRLTCSLVCRLDLCCAISLLRQACPLLGLRRRCRKRLLLKPTSESRVSQEKLTTLDRNPNTQRKTTPYTLPRIVQI